MIYHVKTAKGFSVFVKWIRKNKPKLLGIDTEFSSLNYLNSVLLVVQFGTGDDQFVINWGNLTDKERKFIFSILEDETILKIGHNIKVDILAFISKYAVKPVNVYDTMIGHQILFKGMDSSASYANVVKTYFGKNLKKETQKTFLGKQTVSLTQEEVVYCAKDVYYLVDLYKAQQVGEVKSNMVGALSTAFELPLVLADTEYRGINFDSQKWQKNNEIRKQSLEQKDAQLRELLEQLLVEYPAINTLSYFKNRVFVDFVKEFSFSSPTQLKVLLHYLAKLNSTGKSELQAYLKDSKKASSITEFITILLEYRELGKAVSTYGTKFLNYLGTDGRIRTSFSQDFTTTGRLSSGDIKVPKIIDLGKPTEREVFRKGNLFVNFQNIPKKKEYRECFIADPGYTFGTADLSGAELRIIAGLSQDPLLIDNVLHQLDLHSLLATVSFRIIKKDKLFVVSSTENSNLRTAHKPVLFGILYGASAQRISEILNIPKQVATKIYNALRDLLKPCFTWLDNYVNTSLQQGYAVVNPVSNRRVWLREYNSYMRQGRQMPSNKLENLKRQLYNLPMQGTNADIMKAILKETFEFYKPLPAQILGTVHDELKFQFVSSELWIADATKTLMEETSNKFLISPITMSASLEVANSWTK